MSTLLQKLLKENSERHKKEVNTKGGQSCRTVYIELHYICLHLAGQIMQLNAVSGLHLFDYTLSCQFSFTGLFSSGEYVFM